MTDDAALLAILEQVELSEPRRSRLRRVMGRLLRTTWFPNLLVVAMVIVVWEILVLVLDDPAYIFPGPWSVAHEMVRLRPLLIHDSRATLISVLIAFGIAFGIGFPIAVLMAQSQLADMLLSPVLVLSQAIPKIAIAPVLAIWLGLGMKSIVAVGATIALFPIVVNVALGLKGVDRELLRLGRSMGASRLMLFLKIQLPGALPSIFVALKLGIVFAVIGAVVGEFVGGSSGLGYLIELETGQVQTAGAFAGIVVLSALAVVLYYIVEACERVCVRWLPSREVLMTT